MIHYEEIRVLLGLVLTLQQLCVAAPSLLLLHKGKWFESLYRRLLYITPSVRSVGVYTHLIKYVARY